jgi:monoamine oxidase
VEGAINRRTLVKGAAAGTAAAALPAAAVAAAERSGEKKVDVVVVGAGMAGLYAAQTLKKAGKSVVILEASHRVGGRVLNLQVGPGKNDVSEAGAQWINSDERIIQKLMKRFNLKTYQNYTKGDSSLIIDGQVSRFSGTTIPKLPGRGTQELVKAILRLTRMAKTVPLEAPWEAPRAEEWDSQTCQTFIEDNIENEVARDFAGIAMGGPVSVQAKDLSLLHYLFVGQSCGGPLNMLTIGEGVLSDRIVGGTGRLVEGLAGPLRGITELKTPVTMIERGKRNRVTTPNGKWVADHVVIAMSPTATQNILFDPVLPVKRTQSVQRTGNGSCIKFFPVYDTPFWRDNDLNGIIQSNSEAFSGVFDNSPKDGKPGVLFCLVENVHARALSTMSKAEQQKNICDSLALALGPKARNPKKFILHNWCTDPWLRGGAASFFPPGLLTEYRYLFGKPIGRIHFAGTETGSFFWGNMESALESGERTANEILSS